METKGINELMKVLQKHNGENAVVSISHKIYTSEKIKCNPECFMDDKRMGFRIKPGQEVYIYRNELQDWGIGNEIFFEDDVMKISIKFV